MSSAHHHHVYIFPNADIGLFLYFRKKNGNFKWNDRENVKQSNPKVTALNLQFRKI